MIIGIIMIVSMIGSVYVTRNKSRMVSILCLIITFLSLGLYFIYLNIEYFGWIFILIYIGSMGILFIISLMINTHENYEMSRGKGWKVDIYVIVMIICLGFEPKNSYHWISKSRKGVDSIEGMVCNDEVWSLGFNLFTNHSYFVLIISCILLFSFLGCIYLVKD